MLVIQLIQLSILPCSLLQLKLILSFLIAEEKMDSSESLMYNVDLDGGTLLHLAANSGVLAVSSPKQFSLSYTRWFISK